MAVAAFEIGQWRQVLGQVIPVRRFRRARLTARDACRICDLEIGDDDGAVRGPPEAHATWHRRCFEAAVREALDTCGPARAFVCQECGTAVPFPADIDDARTWAPPHDRREWDHAGRCSGCGRVHRLSFAACRRCELPICLSLASYAWLFGEYELGRAGARWFSDYFHTPACTRTLVRPDPRARGRWDRIDFVAGEPVRSSSGVWGDVGLAPGVRRWVWLSLAVLTALLVWFAVSRS